MSARPRLLAVSPLSGMAGGEVMLMRLLPELVGEWDICLAVPAKGRLWDAARKAGIPITRLPLGPPERRTPASYLGAAIAPLPTARADVVLLNGLSTQRVVPALKLLHRPALLHVDNPLIEPPRAWSRPGFWDQVRLVLTDSAHSAAECVAAGAPAERVRTVPLPAWSGKHAPGATVPRFNTLQRVGFLGQIEPRKGVAELVEAAAGFLRDHPEATLRIVGEAPPGGEEYAERVRARAAASEVGERIEFAGYRPNAAAEMTNKLDLLVVPSLAEPYGTVAAEAAASGVAVVASRVGGLPEVVKEGETGLLVPPGDPVALAAAVGGLLGAPDALRRLGQRALVHSWRFAPRLYAERIDALLRETLGQAPGERPVSSPP